MNLFLGVLIRHRAAMASSVLCGRGEKGAPLLTQRDVQRVSATVRACVLR